MRQTLKKQRLGSLGFSLVEAMVVLAIVAILSSIAIPTYMKWLPNIRLKSATRDLYTNMQKARGEAVKRHVDVVVNFTAVDCTTLVPSAGGSYQILVNSVPTVVLTSGVMPKDVALCEENFGGSTGFTSLGEPIGSNIGHVTLKNNKGRSSTVNLTLTGSLNIK